MSRDRKPSPPSRRTFNRLLIGGAGIAAASQHSWQAVAQDADSERVSLTCNEALQRLLDGNARFRTGKVIHPHSTEQWRQRLTSGQKPFATILGCSDSRVPPEILFDQGFGDLFVIRVAGNVVDPDVTGSIEYGVDHLQTRVIVVMGHEGCGAVTAALQVKEKRAQEPKEIRTLVSKIIPALSSLPDDVDFDQRLNLGVEANVRWSIRQLAAIPDLAKAVAEKRTKIIGCVYELATGRVRVLRET